MADETRRLTGFRRIAPAVEETAAITAGEGAKAGVRGARRAAAAAVRKKSPFTAKNVGRLALGPVGVGIQGMLFSRPAGAGSTLPEVDAQLAAKAARRRALQQRLNMVTQGFRGR